MNAKKAIVLAAGLGTRLSPFTRSVPKPLMPVWGESMLSRIVAMLRDWGVEDIVVNCHSLHEQVETWCADNGLKAVYESEILGTGGVLNPLRDWIGGDSFYLVNGDIVVGGIDENPFEGVDDCCDALAECLVTEEGPRTVEVECESRFITCWDSPDRGFNGTFTYCGIALLKPEILKYVDPSGFSSIVQAYERAMMDGRFVRAHSREGFLWTDAGTVDSYIAINSDGADNAFSDIPHIAAAAKEASLEAEQVKFLSMRGSDRCFFSLGEKGIAVVYDDVKRAENARYASLARFLAANGVSVPKVLADIPSLNTIVLECVGSERRMTLDDYSRVVAALAKFNRIDVAGVELEPSFDDGLFAWERNLFEEHCLRGRYGIEMPDDVRKELERTAAVLAGEPLELVHRDFQSTNILWKGENFSFIDFQGMRKGPALYDLASLLYDPYAEISERERSLLAAYYAKESGRADVAEKLPYAAVQRLVQALGAYGRLASVGQRQFLKYVVPALRNLLAAADEAGLDAVGALSEDLISEEARMGKGGAKHG